jgi:hypothetical protein
VACTLLTLSSQEGVDFFSHAVYTIIMLGSVIKYVGLPKDESYPHFIGHVGYVTHFTPIATVDGKARLAVEWFEPLPIHGGHPTRSSHFALERFEILSEPDNA